MKTMHLVVSVGVVLVSWGLTARGVDFGVAIDGGEWGNASTWTAGGPPGPGDRAFIGSTWAGGLSEAEVNVSSGTHTLSETWVGGYGDALANGLLNISGGTVSNTSHIYMGYYLGSGTVHHTAGAMYTDGQLRMNDNAPLEVYKLDGAGAYLQTASHVYLAIAAGTAAHLEIEDGSMLVGQYLYVGYGGHGTITQNGGLLTVNHAMRGTDGGGSLAYDLNGGQLLVKNTGDGNNYLAIWGAGTMNQAGGTATFSNTLNLDYVGAGIYNLSGGTLNVGVLNKTVGGSAFTFTGGNLSANTINFSLDNAGGTMSPGFTNHVGQTTISGAYNYTETSSGASFKAQLAGTTPVTQYDRLTVGGTATLAGDLEVELLDGFEPDALDTFTIITAATVIGTFANAPVSGNHNLGGGVFDVTYNAGSLVLSNYSPAVVTTTTTTTIGTTTIGTTTSSTTTTTTTSTTTSPTFTVHGHWRLGEDDPGAVAGNTVNATTVDSAGSLDLTAWNPPWATYSANGAPGSGMSVDFNMHNVFSSATPVVTAVDNVGYEIWFRPKSGEDGDRAIFGTGYYELRVASGQIGVHISGYYIGPVTAAPNVSDYYDAWVHLALVREAGTSHVYIDGVPHTFPGNTGPGPTPAALYISQANTTSKHFLDEARVFTFTGAFNPTDLLYETTTSTTTTTSTIGTSTTTTTTTTTSSTTTSPTFTVHGHWRLGEDDPGAVSGNAVNATTVDSAGAFDLTAVNPGFAAYSSARVLNMGTLSVDFDMHTYFYSAVPVVTAVDNVGYELWFKPKVGEDGQRLLMGTAYFDLYVHSGQIGVHISGAYLGPIDGSVMVADYYGKWMHLALVREAGVSRVYVNGVPHTFPNNTFAGPAPTQLLVSQSNFTSKHGLDEARVFTFTGTFDPGALLYQEPVPSTIMIFK